MFSKKERTLEAYAEAGVYMRLLREIMFDATAAVSKVLYAKEIDKLINLGKEIDVFKCMADDQLFKDFHGQANRLETVFYDNIDKDTKEVIKKEIARMVETKIRELSGNQCEIWNGRNENDA